MRPGLTSGSVFGVRALASSDAIGGEVSARRPSHEPDQRGEHPPAGGERDEQRVVVSAAAASVIAASAVAAPALIITVASQEVGEAHAALSRATEQDASSAAHALGAVDDDVGLAR